jgi:hypothetical protein
MKEYACEYADVWYALPHEGPDASGCRIVRAGQNLTKPNYSQSGNHNFEGDV